MILRRLLAARCRAARVVILLAGSLLLVGCGVPQLGTSPAVRKELESLYTAVNSPSRPELLEDSTRRLKSLHEQGEVDDAAHALLESIASEARDGDRLVAAERLYALMRGQSAPE